MQSLRFTNPLQDRMLDNVPNQRLEREREEGIALMEAALMASPQAAVNGPRRRKRTKYNSWQKNLLEKAYAVCKYPNVWTRETLSKALNVDDARIIVWFQNRRARYSRQSAGSHQRGRPTTSNAFETQLPTGTLHYPNTAAPAPNQGPCTGSTRRPLADVMHRPNALPVGHCPVVGSHCPPAPQSLKLECDAFAPSCAVGYGAGLEALPAHGHWCCVAGSPSVGAPARYPVDEIEVDFTVADFNMDLGNEYLLDLSQNL